MLVLSCFAQVILTDCNSSHVILCLSLQPRHPIVSRLATSIQFCFFISFFVFFFRIYLVKQWEMIKSFAGRFSVCLPFIQCKRIGKTETKKPVIEGSNITFQSNCGSVYYPFYPIWVRIKGVSFQIN